MFAAIFQGLFYAVGMSLLHTAAVVVEHPRKSVLYLCAEILDLNITEVINVSIMCCIQDTKTELFYLSNVKIHLPPL